MKLSNLPLEVSSSDVLPLVWGGTVEAVRRTPGSTYASVLFVTCEACARYYDATRKGIRNAFDADDRIINVQPETLDASDLATSKYNDIEASRCIRIAGSSMSWDDAERLETLAGADNRKFESFKLKKTCKVCSQNS